MRIAPGRWSWRCDRDSQRRVGLTLFPRRQLRAGRRDVVLFNYALSPAQIKVLYNRNAAIRFAPVTGTP